MLQRWYILGGLKAGVIMIAVGIYCALTLLGACPEFSLLLRQPCVALLQPAFTPRVCVCCSNVSDCDSMDCSPPGSSVHGLLQARTLEWFAMPSSRGSSRPRDQTQVSCPGLLNCRQIPVEAPVKSNYYAVHPEDNVSMSIISKL